MHIEIQIKVKYYLRAIPVVHYFVHGTIIFISFMVYTGKEIKFCVIKFLTFRLKQILSAQLMPLDLETASHA